MKLHFKGSIIKLEDGDDVRDILYNTICECGHALYLHGCYLNHGTRTLHASQCTRCGVGEDGKFVCGKFEVLDAQN